MKEKQATAKMRREANEMKYQINENLSQAKYAKMLPQQTV